MPPTPSSPPNWFVLHKDGVVKVEHYLALCIFGILMLIAVACATIRILRMCRTKRLVVAPRSGGPTIHAAKVSLERAGVQVGESCSPPRKRELVDPFKNGGVFASSSSSPPKSWLQTDGGVSLSVPVMPDAPPSLNRVGGSRMATDIGGRLMAIISSSHRMRNSLRNMQSWESPARRASPGQRLGLLGFGSSRTSPSKSASPSKLPLLEE